jgi:hypothetical protein
MNFVRKRSPSTIMPRMRDRWAVTVTLSDEERTCLQAWAWRRKTAHGLATRSRIVLPCAEGKTNTAVAQELGVSRPTVRRWRTRFCAKRLEGLLDEPRPGAPRVISDERVEAVLPKTLEERPDGATHWPLHGPGHG